MTILATLVALTAATTLGTSPDTQGARFAGEYGLVVFSDGGSLRVHWITERAAPGLLEVIEASTGRRLGGAETPSGFAHVASLETAGSREVILRYGEATDPGAQYVTRVALASPRRPPVSVRAVDSLYVIGDTHGMHDELVRGLRKAVLVDEELRWIGGRKHLVFAGDVLDRGPDVLRNVWLIYRLEREAAQAGGAVHTLLGNHEIMVMLGDLRYVHPKEIEVAELHGLGYREVFDIRRSVLGRWLASKPALLRVGRVLIAHGGVDEAFTGASLEQIDALHARLISADLFYEWPDRSTAITADSAALERHEAFFWGGNSLFWHRDYVFSDTLGSQLQRVLRHFRSDVLVVGHSATPTPEARYDGRLITAHTDHFGEQVVLLVSDRRGVRRYRIDESGPIPF